MIDASNKVQSHGGDLPGHQDDSGRLFARGGRRGYITADSVPAGFTLPSGLTGPMPPEIADRVAAVTLFGKPSNGFLQTIANAAPPITVGHLYTGKTMDICIPEDPICSPGGTDNNAHDLYAVNGLTDQAADFAARQLASSPATAR